MDENIYDMKRLLVFGAGGFIGRHFVQMFNDKYDIIQVISDAEGNNPDLTDYEALLSIIDKYRPDTVLNLAGKSYHSTKEGGGIYESNAFIQLNLHEAINRLKLKIRVIMCSSSAVYKSSQESIEESSVCLPLNSYARAKYIQEKVGLSYHPSHHIVIARLFNVIGPFQNKNFFIPTVISRVMSYKKNEISAVNLKTLNAMRDFIFIKDVCSALGSLIEHGVSGEVYNVCRGEGVSIEKVIEILKDILDIPEMPVNAEEDYVKEGINYQVGSYEKIAKLGWSPEYNIRESLKEIIKEEYGC